MIQPELFTRSMCGWHRLFNAKPKVPAPASVDCYTLSADAVAFGLALNEMRPTGE
jgi:hypothetical protein